MNGPLPLLFAGLLAAAQVIVQPFNPGRPAPNADDPYLNGTHPVRDPNRDPGHEFDGRRGNGFPGVAQASANWQWGELYYGHTYPTTLAITNNCTTREQVAIFVNGLQPYLNIQRTIAIPAKTTIQLPATITTPAQPAYPAVAGFPIKHGIFLDVAGSVVVWHPMSTAPRYVCYPKREEYTVSAHVHFEAKPDDPEGEKFARAEPCQVWWNTGQRPPQVKDEAECTGQIRTLATEYRVRVLQGYADRNGSAWNWLPSPDAIGRMTIAEALAMKSRAESVLMSSQGRQG